MDTTAEAREVQLGVYRAMTGEQRVALALQLSDEMRQLSIDGIRSRHPDFDDQQVRAEFLCILYGPDLAAEIMAVRPIVIW